jgi:hypothetical protein
MPIFVISRNINEKPFLSAVKPESQANRQMLGP